MSFSFNAGLADSVSQVRSLIGDTDSTTVLLPDETINFYLSEHSVPKAASLCAYDIAAQYARLVTITQDRQQSQYSDLSKQYTALAERLEAQADKVPDVPPGVTPNPTNPTPLGSVIVTGSSRPWYPPLAGGYIDGEREW